MPSASRSPERPPSATTSSEAVKGSGGPEAVGTAWEATAFGPVRAPAMRPPMVWIDRPRRRSAPCSAAPSAPAATTLPKLATPHGAASSRVAPKRWRSET